MTRRQDIEWLRVIATFAIIWYHAGVNKTPAWGHELAYSGLVIFLLLSSYLAGSGVAKVGWSQVQRRFDRLMIPWLVWFVVYGAVNALTHKPITPMGLGSVAGVLFGPAPHLWYMPFAFFCLLLVDVAKSNVAKPVTAMASAVLVILLLLTSPLWRQFSVDLGRPIAQYAHASIGILMGVFFLFFNNLPRLIGLIIIGLFLAAAAYASSCAGVGLPYFIGGLVGLLLVFNRTDGVVLIDIQFLSKLTFGIYFVHILIMRQVERLEPFGWYWVPVVTFMLSAILVALLRSAFPKLAKYWS